MKLNKIILNILCALIVTAGSSNLYADLKEQKDMVQRYVVEYMNNKIDPAINKAKTLKDVTGCVDIVKQLGGLGYIVEDIDGDEEVKIAKPALDAQAKAHVDHMQKVVAWVQTNADPAAAKAALKALLGL